MFISSLILQNLRNFEEAGFLFAPGINCIWGENGAGKSNVLESIFFAATGRPSRAGRDGELIRFGQDFARVEARVMKENKREIILEAALERIEIFSARKFLKINRQPVRKFSDLLGQVKVVFFCPEDEAIVRGEPSFRRRFLDLILSQLFGSYLRQLQTYQGVKEQRNSLLKRPHARSELDPWNTQLIESGSHVLLKRLELIPRLSVSASHAHLRLSGTREDLSLSYLPSFSLPEEPELNVIQEAFDKALARTAREEAERGMTLVGPHRDDLGILLDGVDARLFGSQGQQKTIALSLKLGEGDLYLESDREPPLYLLDDCLSELDPGRQRGVTSLFRPGSQSLITFAFPPPPFLEGENALELSTKRRAQARTS